MTPPPLQRFVDQASGDVLVLHDAGGLAAVEPLAAPTVTLCPVDTAPPEPASRWAAVVLAVTDTVALRKITPALPRLGRTRAVGCWLVEAEGALAPGNRPDWPPLASLQSRSVGEASSWTALRFERAILANMVLEELARSAAPARFHPTAGLVVAQEPGDAETVVPPDAVLAREPLTHAPAYAVTGRPPAVVTDPALLAGPLDEGVLNPTGFVQRPDQGVVDLQPTDTWVRGATPRLVTELRDHQGARVTWDGDESATVRLVAGLAMAGVPLVSGPIPATAGRHLGTALSEVLGLEVDLTDPLRREEHSVRLRRAALLTHSTLGWGARLAEAAGLPHRRFPSVSIVLATKRPEQLDFALRQVARQRGAEIELVVAAHGFSPDEARVRELAGHPASVVALHSDTLFGDVLNAGVARSSGDLVVKMDDDDWYGPDFVTDLLLARHYSGADLTGMTAEFVYLETLDATIRRRDESERPAKFVAGGTMMVERGFLAHVGAFRPVHRFVDAQLLAATAAVGGTVYRTHGLGYVLRRSAAGHTWDADADYFLDPKRLDRQWPGFAPSRLLAHDPADVPHPADGGA